MKTIWKFPLVICDTQGVTMPEGAKPLAVQLQGDTLCLWALVDPDAPKVCNTIDIRGTGHPCPDHLGEHIGTFQLSGGALIFHVFGWERNVEGGV